MQCPICDPSIDHEVLLNCQTCGKGFCQRHIDTHLHQKSQTYQIDLSQLFQQQSAKTPTKQDYEMFLRANPQIFTTGSEILDLGIAVLLLTWVFGFQPLLQGQTWQYVLMLVIIIGSGYILHELAHKYTAIHFGQFSRFTILTNMAIISIVAGAIGIPVALIGATMSLGRSTKQQVGISSLAGPIVNIVLALLSIGIGLLVPAVAVTGLSYSLKDIFFLSAYINSFIAGFNLIPFSIIDGKKIYDWNRLAWLGTFGFNMLIFLFATNSFDQFVA